MFQKTHIVGAPLLRSIYVLLQYSFLRVRVRRSVHWRKQARCKLSPISYSVCYSKCVSKNRPLFSVKLRFSVVADFELCTPLQSRASVKPPGILLISTLHSIYTLLARWGFPRMAESGTRLLAEGGAQLSSPCLPKVLSKAYTGLTRRKNSYVDGLPDQ